MSRTLLLCLPFFFALLAQNEAFVCESDACDQITCEDISEVNCDGRIVKNGGLCGCCDVCIEQLEHGEKCLEHVLTLLPLKTECKEGLVCHQQRHVCVAEDEVV